MSIWIFFKLIGALALLMFGMKTMSDSLQKMAGPQLRHVLGTMTPSFDMCPAFSTSPPT